MAGVAEIFDAVLKPTKQELGTQWLGYFDPLGSYRFVDPNGEVGIESLIGRDPDDRLVQLPLTYRAEEFNPEITLSTMEHSVLGKRWVSNALGDPVAVKEYLRTILEADTGASFSDGTRPALDVVGTGSEEVPELGEVKVWESTRQRCRGEVECNGRKRSFILYVPALLVPVATPRAATPSPRCG